jgi:hypothetical protein
MLTSSKVNSSLTSFTVGDMVDWRRPSRFQGPFRVTRVVNVPSWCDCGADPLPPAHPLYSTRGPWHGNHIDACQIHLPGILGGHPQELLLERVSDGLPLTIRVGMSGHIRKLPAHLFIKLPD